MFRRAETPVTLFDEQFTELQEYLPGVFDGISDSIHDARVATRRIRELLPILIPRGGKADDLRRQYRKIGRALGRVRDTDVLIELLASLETRIPHAAPTLVVVRQGHERERLSQTRSLVRTLERLLDVEHPRDGVAEGLTDTLVPVKRLTARPGWREAVRLTRKARAETAAQAIVRASGVYFPNRVHDVRIALKKLRYVLEIAESDGDSHAHEAGRSLREVQDLLGEVHDRQVLVDELSAAADTSPDEIKERLTLVIQVVDAEKQELHAKYLTMRKLLLKLCRAEFERRAPAARFDFSRPVTAAGALAATAAVFALSRTVSRSAPAASSGQALEPARVERNRRADASRSDKTTGTPKTPRRVAAH